MQEKCELGCLVLETGEVFQGYFFGNKNKPQAGEVVFNTSHSGYEEIATDPSYFSQIVVMTAPMQGNYGSHSAFWESQKLWIRGLIVLEMQSSLRDNSWRETLKSQGVPFLTHVDTRRLVLHIRKKGVLWGAILPFLKNAKSEASKLIKQAKKQNKDWTQPVSTKSIEEFKGRKSQGPRVALIDFGCKKNILRELKERCSAVSVFPASTEYFNKIKKWKPDGILLSNGPGDPEDVNEGVELVKKLLGWKFIFGICMGNQILCRSVGAKNYKLKFGHRGSNHPIKDGLLNKVYIASQNHGYAIDANTLPKDVKVSHINLNDQTVAGIYSGKYKFLGVQFHPENHPGPKESSMLFDLFIKNIKSKKDIFQAKVKHLNIQENHAT